MSTKKLVVEDHDIEPGIAEDHYQDIDKEDVAPETNLDQLNFTNTIIDFIKMCIWFYLFTNHGSKFTFWPKGSGKIF